MQTRLQRRINGISTVIKSGSAHMQGHLPVMLLLYHLFFGFLGCYNNKSWRIDGSSRLLMLLFLKTNDMAEYIQNGRGMGWARLE
ncbi:hypothetical protein I7I50_10352 [Histoplasma capsulatum G186AR]|uniref:Uncharacterized protein n=1 Tax=Ajellomyces capsulatus TaxID=5037 RepID=A0A8H7Z6B5_AJECA|nr:hypothetical protein I7I52_01591 [Histoplasma capsulatum]QSS69158.1 hypothetical protein I7I50_10352 [Histoplasma capsulatum G186AR]